MQKIFTLLAAVCALATTSAAGAQEIDTLCKVEWTRTDGSQIDILRQYEIDGATGIVNVYDNTGSGFALALEVKNARLEATKLVLAERPGLYHELNRLTGMMFSITRYDNGTVERKRGICSRSNKLSAQ